MKVTISDPDIAKALDIIKVRSINEMRVLTPNPGNEPYWHHMARVYYWLTEYGVTDMNTKVASILHDGVEDGYISLEEVQELFGDQVTAMVWLISEKTNTDHNTIDSRDNYFETMLLYTDSYIQTSVMAIKVADRYDNCIGLSYVGSEEKKQQYRDEIHKYLFDFADRVGMPNLLEEALAILNNEIKPPNIELEVVYDFSGVNFK